MPTKPDREMHIYIPRVCAAPMGTSQIIDDIEKLVAHRGQPYGSWVIGVTDNPARRKSEHEQADSNTSWWHDWNPGTEQSARDVERHFLNKGMQGGTGGSGRADYVYIF